MEDKLRQLIYWGLLIAFIILGIFVSKIIFENVMASNMPDWLKWMILR